MVKKNQSRSYLNHLVSVLIGNDIITFVSAGRGFDSRLYHWNFSVT